MENLIVKKKCKSFWKSEKTKFTFPKKNKVNHLVIRVIFYLVLLTSINSSRAKLLVFVPL